MSEKEDKKQAKPAESDRELKLTVKFSKKPAKEDKELGITARHGKQK